MSNLFGPFREQTVCFGREAFFSYSDGLNPDYEKTWEDIVTFVNLLLVKGAQPEDIRVKISPVLFNKGSMQTSVVSFIVDFISKTFPL